MTPPRWFYPLVVFAALVIAGASVVAAVTFSRGHWFVADYESRGPSRLARVLVNDRTGVVCEVNRQGGVDNPLLGNDAFWMCSRPAQGGKPFLP